MEFRHLIQILLYGSRAIQRCFGDSAENWITFKKEALKTLKVKKLVYLCVGECLRAKCGAEVMMWRKS